MRFFLLMTLLIPLSLTAQNRMEGIWAGHMVMNGLDGANELPFELFLEVKSNGTVTGASYLYLKNGDVVEMTLQGRMYGDRSVYMEEYEHLPIVGSSSKPVYSRKYEFQMKRFLTGDVIKGFWQQIIGTPLFPKRSLGRIELKRVKKSKV